MKKFLNKLKGKDEKGGAKGDAKGSRRDKFGIPEVRKYPNLHIFLSFVTAS